MKKGYKLSEEAKRRIGKANSVNMLGKIRGDSFKKKMSEVNLKKIADGTHPFYKHGLSKNPEYRNWQKNQWHHRNRSADGSHTFGEWENLKAQYNWTCPNCKRKESESKLTLDHIIPLSKGGSNNIENIQPLCINCNCRKQAKTILY